MSALCGVALPAAKHRTVQSGTKEPAQCPGAQQKDTRAAGGFTGTSPQVRGHSSTDDDVPVPAARTSEKQRGARSPPLLYKPPAPRKARRRLVPSQTPRVWRQQARRDVVGASAAHEGPNPSSATPRGTLHAPRRRVMLCSKGYSKLKPGEVADPRKPRRAAPSCAARPAGPVHSGPRPTRFRPCPLSGCCPERPRAAGPPQNRCRRGAARARPLRRLRPPRPGDREHAHSPRSPASPAKMARRGRRLLYPLRPPHPGEREHDHSPRSPRLTSRNCGA